VNAVGWTFVGLAGGFVLLALYGKYRMIKDDFHEAQEEEARRAGYFDGEEPEARI
jgi:hypothetical protein